MKRHLYNFCSEKVKNALQYFCENINECDAEILIVMAQKAICLYRILEHQGLVPKKNIYSSVTLDFNRADFVGKRIAIVDDIIVSGSAISNTAKKLLEAGVDEDNIQIIALARDADFQTMLFTNTKTEKNILKCGISISDVECIELSYEISHILAYYGMPYDADYPAYNDFRIDSNVKQKIEVSPLWEVYDITGQIQSDGNISVYTVFPTQFMKSKVWGKLGIDLDSHIHLKLRLYLSFVNNQVTSMQVVPMALFHELSLNNTEKLFQWFSDNIFPQTTLTKGWSKHAQFRFLQYYIAHILMSVFTEELHIEAPFNEDVFSHQFGALTLSELFSILQSRNKSSSVIVPDLKTIEPDLLGNQPFEFNNQTFKTYDINDFLIKPFVSRHEHEEMDARNALRYPVKHYIKDADKIRKISQRLRRGLSLRALVKLAAPLDAEYDLEKVVSLFIDRAIDYGIIVPIFYFNKENEYFCRAYRHGEDLPFGKADQARTLFFLKCFYECLDKYNTDQYIAPVSFEKILVLFFQMGIRQRKIFNRFLGFDNYPLLKERFCVHGAVETITYRDSTPLYAEYDEADKSTDDDYARWITSWLGTDGGIGAIAKTRDRYKRRTHYHIDIDKTIENLPESHLNNLSQDIQDDIEAISDVIAKWYSLSQRKKKDVFKKDITALTSCYDSYVFISAIVTEIHYFYRYWCNQGKAAINTIKLTGNDAVFRYKTVGDALYSGREKAEWFEDQRAQKVIEKVGKLLKKSNGNWYLWNGIWKSEITPYTPDIGRETDEALCYLYFYSLCYFWLTSGRLQQTNFEWSFWEEENEAKIKELFIKHAEKAGCVDKSLLSIFDIAEQEPNIIQRTQLFEQYVERVLSCSEKLIDKVQSILSNNCETYSVRYESCLIFDIKCPERTASDNLMISFWDSLPENNQKTKFNIVQFGAENGYFRYGLFYQEPCREQANGYLIEKYLKLRSYAVSCGYLTRAIYVPRIPARIVFKQDLKSHICQYVKDFSDKLINELSKQYLPIESHQMLLFQTDDLGEQSIISPKTLGFTNTIATPSFEIQDITEKLVGWALYTDNAITMKATDIYSSVYIVDENNVRQGSGILLSFKNKIYCITCAHVLEDVNQAYVYVVGCANSIAINRLYSDKTTDVAILAPEWNLNTPIDISRVFCMKDCIEDETEAKKIPSYRCYGFPSDTGDYITEITYVGMSRNNRYILRSNPRVDLMNRFIPGFSGAAVVSENDFHLLGIHSNGSEYSGDCIPCQAILSALESHTKQEKGETT